jgi:hypothetical protein
MYNCSFKTLLYDSERRAFVMCLKLIFQVQKGIRHIRREKSYLSKPLLCQQHTLSHSTSGVPAPLYFITDEERMLKETGTS